MMTHFLLGLDISTIPVAPWVPWSGRRVLQRSGARPRHEPEALAFVFPNAGSYVGGDITAGIIATGMHLSDRANILVDVGTNAEVVIGNKEWMIVGQALPGRRSKRGSQPSGSGRTRHRLRR